MMKPLQFLDETAAEQPRQYAHRQEEPAAARYPALPVTGNAAARHDAMHVRMVRQCRTPGMQDQRRTDVCAQMFRIGRDGDQRFRRHLEQKPVDGCLVGVGDGTAIAYADVVNPWKKSFTVNKI